MNQKLLFNIAAVTDAKTKPGADLTYIDPATLEKPGRNITRINFKPEYAAPFVDQYFRMACGISFTHTLDKREHHLFDICKQDIKTVMEEFDDPELRKPLLLSENKKMETFIERVQEIVLYYVQEQIEYYRNNHNDYKNIFLYIYSSKGRITKIYPDFLTRTGVARSNGESLPSYTPESKAIALALKKIKIDNPGIWTTAFDEHIADRFHEKYADRDVAAYRDQLIDKVNNKTVLMIITETTYLLPGIDDVLLRSTYEFDKIPEDIKKDPPYALWFGDRFGAKLVEDEGPEGLARFFLEGALWFDMTNDQAIPRNEPYWQTMAARARAIEPVNQLHTRGDTFIRMERLYRKMLDLTAEEKIQHFNARRSAIIDTYALTTDEKDTLHDVSRWFGGIINYYHKDFYGKNYYEKAIINSPNFEFAYVVRNMKSLKT